MVSKALSAALSPLIHSTSSLFGQVAFWSFARKRVEPDHHGVIHGCFLDSMITDARSTAVPLIFGCVRRNDIFPFLVVSEAAMALILITKLVAPDRYTSQ